MTDIEKIARLERLLWEAIDYAASHPVEARCVDPMTWHHLLTYSTYTPEAVARRCAEIAASEPRVWAPAPDPQQRIAAAIREEFGLEEKP